MLMEPVQSSNISHVGYDAERRVLRIRFSNGGEYEYAGVPASEYEALRNAPSIGTHFSLHVRRQHKGVRLSSELIEKAPISHALSPGVERAMELQAFEELERAVVVCAVRFAAGLQKADAPSVVDDLFQLRCAVQNYIAHPLYKAPRIAHAKVVPSRDGRA
jgi:hypothetical protein